MGPRFRFLLWRWGLRLERLRARLPRPASPGQLMLVAFALVVAAWLMRNFRVALWQPVAVAALVIFLLALITSFGRPSTMTQRQVYWRGRVVGERRIPWWERFYRWLYRR